MGESATEMYGHPATLDYMDRWMDEPFMTEEYLDTGRTYYEEWQYHQPTTVYYTTQQTGGWDMVNQMWAAYR